VENGAIMTAASRWSLLIDPQLQGIQWIIRREQPAGLVITQQSAPRYIEQAAPRPARKGTGLSKPFLSGAARRPRSPACAHRARVRPQVVKCIEAGLPLLLENLSESIDAVLDPVIGKLVTKRGRATVLKLGDAEVEYNPNFRCARRRTVQGAPASSLTIVG